eukprot:m.281377 g.281377  ORF g.281377 m.281377 type:complete len:299 (-) comp54929_c0_seq2:165-1061(-)
MASSERTGFFSEPSYISIGNPYRPVGQPVFNASATKGKQLMTTSSKSKTAFADGYFEPKFPRVMEGESYFDPVAQRRKEALEKKKKNLTATFVPSSGTKSTCGSGSYMATFAGKVEAFSPAARPQPEHRKEPRNFLTNPSPQGTYGFPNTTIGKPAPYASEAFDAARELTKKEFQEHKARMKGGAFKVDTAVLSEPFDANPFKPEPLPPAKPAPPAKKITAPFAPTRKPPTMSGSGFALGTLTPYPSHADEPPRERPPKPESDGRKFKPTMTTKSPFSRSVMDATVHKRVNASNFQSM